MSEYSVKEGDEELRVVLNGICPEMNPFMLYYKKGNEHIFMLPFSSDGSCSATVKGAQRTILHKLGPKLLQIVPQEYHNIQSSPWLQGIRPVNIPEEATRDDLARILQKYHIEIIEVRNTINYRSDENIPRATPGIAGSEVTGLQQREVTQVHKCACRAAADIVNKVISDLEQAILATKSANS